ncbi:hypothetical protein GC176_21575 [bacterium]|nr:hypothetical protein [bacterium]
MSDDAETFESPTPTGTSAADPVLTATEPAAAEPHPGRRRVPIWLRVIIFLTCYVLSIGPMFWVWCDAEYFSGNPLVRVFYAPLRLLCGIQFFEDWLNRYINWWIA